ncbi:NUDIX domain-containing protein [Candidatus Pacearchaeota archaeon]|nr:NUDIX domain-containing protein [Candidatus Pacearchaeota archaeon]MBD3282722.1 NUDIX domain-containing protein [Candidatus Pacearchaeota archaeon]
MKSKKAPKKGEGRGGREMHYSVGAVIKRNNKYLLIGRSIFPKGFAGIAGHVDKNENETDALIREVKEESGLNIVSFKLLYQGELDWNECVMGVGVHYWYLFKCEVEGKVKKNHEAKSIGWYSPEDIKELYKKKKLEKVWIFWFRKLGVL